MTLWQEVRAAFMELEGPWKFLYAVLGGLGLIGAGLTVWAIVK